MIAPIGTSGIPKPSSKDVSRMNRKKEKHKRELKKYKHQLKEVLEEKESCEGQIK